MKKLFSCTVDDIEFLVVADYIEEVPRLLAGGDNLVILKKERAYYDYEEDGDVCFMELINIVEVPLETGIIRETSCG